ncbi:MerR family transcriptional regulator [Staphylococcus warneri]|uniref:MerR family transcriptional regulator n=1 Tax=Staphylococcus warneri TaxID=1292 RepID=UPI0025413391|nr:MerR family transcriptional regulator [Staphylococcus warneri]MDK4213638.1 MerR family transcriptional regulator [Staphylococcus warneri]
MSYYTTGEIAERCQVSVRTVQYYDQKGILKPSQMSETNRRMYSEDDVKRLELIILLKHLGCSLNDIKKLLKEDSTMNTLNYILSMKEESLSQEVNDKQNIIKTIKTMKQYINAHSVSPIQKLTDIERMAQGSIHIRGIHKNIFITAGLISIAQYTGIISSIILKNKRSFLTVSPFVISYAIALTYYYAKKVAFVCPNCHTQFHPALNQLMIAKHTLNTRRLKCPNCHEIHYCIETPAQSS